jgi:HSP20 family protein
MVETTKKIAVKKVDAKPTAPAPVPASAAWHPIGNLRREIDRLFEDFDRGSWLRPFRGGGLSPAFSLAVPAVNMVERAKAFEVTAELAGMDEKNIQVSVRNGNLIISGEKTDEKEEHSKDYHVRERQFGSFERMFSIPPGVDAGKIEAQFKNGVLTVTIPKTAEALKPEKKIPIKAA